MRDPLRFALFPQCRMHGAGPAAMKKVSLLFSSQDANFAASVEGALKADGFDVVHLVETARLDAASAEAEALAASGLRLARRIPPAPAPTAPTLVIWSAAAAADASLMRLARASLDARVLVPISIGKSPPPQGFEHLWPMDLAGWTHKSDDPRWRFVIEEIAIAARRCAPALADESPVEKDPVEKDPVEKDQVEKGPPETGKAETADSAASQTDDAPVGGPVGGPVADDASVIALSDQSSANAQQAEASARAEDPSTHALSDAPAEIEAPQTPFDQRTDDSASEGDAEAPDSGGHDLDAYEEYGADFVFGVDEIAPRSMRGAPAMTPSAAPAGAAENARARRLFDPAQALAAEDVTGAFRLTGAQGQASSAEAASDADDHAVDEPDPVAQPLTAPPDPARSVEAAPVALGDLQADGDDVEASPPGEMAIPAFRAAAHPARVPESHACQSRRGSFY